MPFLVEIANGSIGLRHLFEAAFQVRLQRGSTTCCVAWGLSLSRNRKPPNHGAPNRPTIRLIPAAETERDAATATSRAWCSPYGYVGQGRLVAVMGFRSARRTAER